MGAMRVPHELGFYGLNDARARINITPPAEPDVVADWMLSDVEDDLDEHESIVAAAGLDEHDEVVATVGVDEGDEVVAPVGLDERDEVVPAAEVEKLNLDDRGRPQTPEDDNRSGTDLIVFT